MFWKQNICKAIVLLVALMQPLKVVPNSQENITKILVNSAGFIAQVAATSLSIMATTAVFANKNPMTSVFVAIAGYYAYKKIMSSHRGSPCWFCNWSVHQRNHQRSSGIISFTI